MKKENRIFYIDNLRIFLIALVVLHHLSITYGAIGGWYYKEVESDTLDNWLLTMFTASNQSFFMGFFFLISAYFTHFSFQRKTIGTFVKDRIMRLGIPLMVFYFLISPLTIYMKVRYGDGADIGFLEFVKVHHGFGFGPLWFVETLIYFSFIYVIYKLITANKQIISSQDKPFPKTTSILLLILGISAVSFVVRLWYSLGSEIPHTGLQLPYFPQYIAMLTLGLLFAKYQWFEKITYRQGIRWIALAQIFIFIIFPLFLLLGGADITPYTGGWTWQSAVLCIWEQVVGISLMIGLTGIFKKKLNKQGAFTRKLSGAAYAVFVIHAFVIVSLSIFFKNWEIYPDAKFITLAPVALILCFALAIFIKKIPGVNRII